jgi:acyl-homoserine-lactone acylase
MSFATSRLFRFAALAAAACLSLNAQTPYKTQKGTEILWDKWGVPHVFARSVPDMYFCYGWAQAEAHGDLLLRAYGNSRGRAAEYFGPGVADKNIKNDRWVWTNEIPSRAAKWLAVQSPAYRGYLDAFVAGINGYAAKHPEALDAEVKQVLPLTTLDVIEREQLFINFEFVASPRLMDPVVSSRASLEQPIMSPFDPRSEDMQDGSNGWAIAPSKSASGRAMLLMNPHLAWGGEQSYFEVQLTAPGVNLYGATQVGLPAMRFVFTDQLAITNTVNTNNGVLQYRITEKDGGYLFDGKVRPYERANYSFKIKQADGSFKTEPVEVLKTVHGPIVRRDAGVPIAIHVVGLDKPYLLEQVWKMGTAKNFAEYQAQLKRLQIPMYNILYADQDGHIEYLFNAVVPKRTGDWAMWQRPVAGDTSSLLPTEVMSYEELPKAVDPASGYVQNSNEPPWDAAWPTMIEPAKFPAYISPTFGLFRSDRALRMLSEDKKISYEMLLEKKLSTRMEFADRILPDLLAAVDRYGSPRAKQAAAVLKAWDRQTEAESRGALLFYTWAQRFVNPAVTLNAKDAQRNFAVKYDVHEPLTTPRGLADPAAAAAMLDAAAEETVRTYGALDTPWGKVMRLELNGQSDGNTAAPRGAALNGVDLPGNGGYGNLGIFRVVTYGPMIDGIKTPVHGDGFTIALEFGSAQGVPLKAKSLVSYGDCSQPGCAHHTDQLPLVEKKQWRDVWRTKAEVEANLEKKEVF